MVGSSLNVDVDIVRRGKKLDALRRIGVVSFGMLVSDETKKKAR